MDNGGSLAQPLIQVKLVNNKAVSGNIVTLSLLPIISGPLYRERNCYSFRSSCRLNRYSGMISFVDVSMTFKHKKQRIRSSIYVAVNENTWCNGCKRSGGFLSARRSVIIITNMLHIMQELAEDPLLLQEYLIISRGKNPEICVMAEYTDLRIQAPYRTYRWFHENNPTDHRADVLVKSE